MLTECRKYPLYYCIEIIRKGIYKTPLLYIFPMLLEIQRPILLCIVLFFKLNVIKIFGTLQSLDTSTVSGEIQQTERRSYMLSSSIAGTFRWLGRVMFSKWDTVRLEIRCENSSKISNQCLVKWFTKPCFNCALDVNVSSLQNGRFCTLQHVWHIRYHASTPGAPVQTAIWWDTDW